MEVMDTFEVVTSKFGRIFSHEIPSDIIVHVAGVPFSLHKVN